MKLHTLIPSHASFQAKATPRFSGSIQADQEFLSYIPPHGLEPLNALVRDRDIHVNLLGARHGGFIALGTSPVGEFRHTNNSASDLMRQCSTSIRTLINSLLEEQDRILQEQVKSLMETLASFEAIEPEEVDVLEKADGKALQAKVLELKHRLAPHLAKQQTEAAEAAQAQQRSRMIQQIAVFESFLRESSSGKLVERPEITDAISDEQLTLIHATLRADVLKQCPVKRTQRGTDKARRVFIERFEKTYGFRP